MFFFFFKQKTAYEIYQCDWSSDVCSSDLDIALLGGLTSRMPVMAFFLLLMAFSSIGLPGLNGFVGEVMVLLGMFREHWVYAAFATAGIVLGAWYMLWLVERTFFGPLREPRFDDREKPVPDVTRRELAEIGRASCRERV